MNVLSWYIWCKPFFIFLTLMILQSWIHSTTKRLYGVVMLTMEMANNSDSNTQREKMTWIEFFFDQFLTVILSFASTARDMPTFHGLGPQMERAKGRRKWTPLHVSLTMFIHLYQNGLTSNTIILQMLNKTGMKLYMELWHGIVFLLIENNTERFAPFVCDIKKHQPMHNDLHKKKLLNSSWFTVQLIVFFVLL